MDITRLEIHGKPEVFHPFAIKALSLRRFFVTDPTSSVVYLTEISEDWGSMRILHDIKPPCVQLPVFCYPYSQDTLIMTDVNKDTPAVHFVTIDEVNSLSRTMSASNSHSTYANRINHILLLTVKGVVYLSMTFSLEQWIYQSGAMIMRVRTMVQWQLPRCNTPVESQESHLELERPAEKLTMLIENCKKCTNAAVICSLGEEPVKTTTEASRDKFQMRF